MHSQQETELLKSFKRMTDQDRLMLMSFAGACVRENPRAKPLLSVIIGGRGAAGRIVSGDVSRQYENLPSTRIVRP